VTVFVTDRSNGRSEVPVEPGSPRRITHEPTDEVIRSGPELESRHASPATHRGRVLIVEDEADLAWVEQFNLQDEGYDVEVALEGLAAIEALDRFAPQLMVLDVMLPHVNGWKVLERAHELPSERRPKVILVSAVAGIRELADAEGIPVVGILSKPFDMDELVRMVGDTMGGPPSGRAQGAA
jgi:CheY-like chemotaxis protein